MSRLTIVRGLPGSGKSTYVQNNFPGVFHVENDMYWMVDGEYSYDKSHRLDCTRWAFNTIRVALQNGMDVVTSCVFAQKDIVRRFVNLARENGADYQVIRMVGDHKSIHDVPQNVLDSMKHGFEDYPGETIVNT